jgi:hypothetical protein
MTMLGPVIGIAGAAALLAMALGWLMARRYGPRRAMVVPVLAVAASALSVCRASGLDPGEAMGRAAMVMAFAGPAVLGGLIGIRLARPKR